MPVEKTIGATAAAAIIKDIESRNGLQEVFKPMQINIRAAMLNTWAEIINDLIAKPKKA